MPEDTRREASIRRMASQKVAAEMVKGATYDSQEEARTAFIELVDWIDADVVAAGDRAESPPKPPASPTQAPPSNGTSDTASEPLSTEQASRMVAMLGEVDPEVLKLQLWQMELPQTTIPDAVKVMTKGQAKHIVAWMKEQNIGA